MPSSALRPCTHIGCTTLVKAGRCKAHSLERTFVRDPSVKKLYNSPRWQRIRRQQLALAVIPSLADYPLCKLCLIDGMLAEATEVDHVHPHRGDAKKFFDGPFQCLCKQHHSSKTKAEIQYRDRYPTP